ncbi:MAG: Methylated-DNA--protein-cysteine methyltransferase [ANME-2 cluster archaeon]|nr:Methylated-DNA--protein-cysteine methyltransferase [ANME-2 cluster archaeon]
MDCFFSNKVKRWVAVEANSVSIRSVKLFEQCPGDERMTFPVTHDLQRYFMGEKVDFSSYDVDLSGFTPFRQEVLTATRSVHRGTCITYSRLAGMVGRPKAVRAVGNALGLNRVPVIIPCHRIVSKHGPGGYSLGVGLKLELLRLESIEF